MLGEVCVPLDQAISKEATEATLVDMLGGGDTHGHVIDEVDLEYNDMNPTDSNVAKAQVIKISF